MRPINLSNKTEIQWAKDWLIGRAHANELPLSLDAVLRAFTNGSSDEAVIQKIIQEISSDGAHRQDLALRAKLQKALSARRKRHAQRNIPVPATLKPQNVQVTTEAAEMLLFCAQERGVTTSELIKEILEKEYEQRKGWISGAY